jgi:hypothetical protein
MMNDPLESAVFWFGFAVLVVLLYIAVHFIVKFW